MRRERTYAPSSSPPARRGLARHHTALVIAWGILAGGSATYAWSSAHWKITKAALDALPTNESRHWRAYESGFRKYCIYPDMGLANDEARKYLVVVRGRPLHYFPRDNKADYEIFNEGTRVYFSKIVSEMRQGRYDEAARYAGALAHVLEDLSQPQCHSLRPHTASI